METSAKDKSSLERILKYFLDLVDLHKRFSEALQLAEHFKRAIYFNLGHIGQCVGELSNDFKDFHNEIPWQSIISMRNVLFHDHPGIDELKVIDVLNNELFKLGNFANAIIRNGEFNV